MGHAMGDWGRRMAFDDEPYIQTWHGRHARLVVWHVWPMMFAAWMLFVLGVMVGTKRSMMMQRMRMMGGMPMGMGMGMGAGGGPCGPKMMHHHHGGMMHNHAEGMQHHHHHGGDMKPCCEKHEAGVEQTAEA